MSEGRGKGGPTGLRHPSLGPKRERGLARAAPSPGQARVGIPLATTARRCWGKHTTVILWCFLTVGILGVPASGVPESPPGPQVQARLRKAPSGRRTAGGQGQQFSVAEGSLSAWTASSAMPPGRNKTTSRQPPLSGACRPTAPSRGGWPEPSRRGSSWPKGAAEGRAHCATAGLPGTPKQPERRAPRPTWKGQQQRGVHLPKPAELSGGRCRPVRGLLSRRLGRPPGAPRGSPLPRPPKSCCHPGGAQQ